MLELIAALALATPPGPPALDRGYLQLDTGFFTSSGRVSFFPSISARVPIIEYFAVEADLPFVAVVEDSESRLVFGNMGLRGLVRTALADEQTYVEGGIGITFGTAPSGDALTDVAFMDANRMAGLRRNFEVTPGTASVSLPARGESHFANGIFIRGDALVGLSFSTNPDMGDTVVQLNAEGAVGMMQQQWEGSLALAVAGLIPTGRGQDSIAQVALIPMGRYYSRPDYDENGAVYLETSFNINLDEPYGFSVDNQRFWGWFFGVGYLLPRTY